MKTKLPLQALSAALFLFLSSEVFSQHKELSLGGSFSSYRFDSRNAHLNTNSFLPGIQLGYLYSPKLNLLRKIKKGIISPYSNIEYALVNCALNNSNKLETLSLHQLRFSLPIRLRLAQNKKATASFYILGEPGIQLTAFQYSQSETIFPNIEPLETYLNTGLGITLSKKQKEIKKAGFKYTGITINASRMIPINTIRFFENQGSLTQFRANVGIKYSYFEPKKSKRLRFRW